MKHHSSERSDQEHYSETYFVAKLTNSELKLFADKNEDHMATYFRGSKADVTEEEIKMSESRSKYVRAQWPTSLIVKNYQISDDKYYFFEFMEKSETIHVSFHKLNMSCDEMEALAKFEWGNRHACAVQMKKYLKEYSLDFVELSALKFLKVNPFYEKLIDEGWADALVSLSTSKADDSIFYQLAVFQDDENLQDTSCRRNRYSNRY